MDPLSELTDWRSPAGIGNWTRAVGAVDPCSTTPAGQKVSGFLTYFSDDVYACDSWNGRAKKTKDMFVALNGVCGMDNSKYCDRCVAIQGADGKVLQPVRVIDFCDPSNCGYLKKEHLDVLDNNGNAAYKQLDQGVNNKDGLPVITWWWLPSCSADPHVSSDKSTKSDAVHVSSSRSGRSKSHTNDDDFSNIGVDLILSGRGVGDQNVDHVWKLVL
eukprot:m51a1_g10751 hypothetical protein (216) ;mRNA; f:365002-368246